MEQYGVGHSPGPALLTSSRAAGRDFGGMGQSLALAGTPSPFGTLLSSLARAGTHLPTRPRNHGPNTLTHWELVRGMAFISLGTEIGDLSKRQCSGVTGQIGVKWKGIWCKKPVLCIKSSFTYTLCFMIVQHSYGNRQHPWILEKTVRCWNCLSKSYSFHYKNIFKRQPGRSIWSDREQSKRDAIFVFWKTGCNYNGWEKSRLVAHLFFLCNISIIVWHSFWFSKKSEKPSTTVGFRIRKGKAIFVQPEAYGRENYHEFSMLLWQIYNAAHSY